MDNRDWMILQVLYEHKNITKTAQHLFMSQPALTSRLRQIENEFGVQIVLRGRRGVLFTPEGEYLARCADDMLLRLRQMKEHALNMNDEVVGTLRLGVSNFFIRHQLPGLLKLFKDQYPLVEFKVITGWSRDVYNQIYNQEVHVGFVRGDYPWREPKHLLHEETICIASTQELDMKSLPQLPRIDYETDHLFKSLIDHWWTANYDQPPYIGMEVDKAESCKAMVVNGLGYAILPSLVLEDENKIYKTVLTDNAGEPLLRKTWMYYHEETLQLNLVRAFIDFVKGLDLMRSL
jgi:DNA-binding transcriptional LysR family regulator